MSDDDVFWMGCGAGFSGGRVDAAVSVVEAIAASGKPGAIMFETLAERTLALGHVARRLDPEGGYEPLLDQFLPPILARCLRADIPIVGNFGAANPPAAARRIKQLAAERGLPEPRVALVVGDDVKDALDLRTMDVFEADTGLAREDAKLIAANAYLGAKPIADALLAGAQIVVTGRVADPALALGPLVAHFGWDWDDLDRLAAGTLAGHLLECGAQVTGGYFADPGYKDVDRPEAIGFPIVEMRRSGEFVVTKARGTGGRVDRRTVTEQILYEVHDPAAYLTPDVTLDITGVELQPDGADRVRVRGARGHAKPPTLKATVSFEGDWLGEAEISYAGPNAMARAKLAAQVIGDRITMRQLAVKRRLDLIGALAVFDDDASSLASDGPDAPEVRVRLAASASERRPVEQSVQEVLALLCCGPAGGGGFRQKVSNRIRTVSYLVPRDRVHPSFVFA